MPKLFYYGPNAKSQVNVFSYPDRALYNAADLDLVGVKEFVSNVSLFDDIKTVIIYDVVELTSKVLSEVCGLEVPVMNNLILVSDVEIESKPVSKICETFTLTECGKFTKVKEVIFDLTNNLFAGNLVQTLKIWGSGLSSDDRFYLLLMANIQHNLNCMWAVINNKDDYTSGKTIHQYSLKVARGILRRVGVNTVRDWTSEWAKTDRLVRKNRANAKYYVDSLVVFISSGLNYAVFTN